jgi:mannose-6-phosphate isomerase-like protein (cupin superfamily)
VQTKSLKDLVHFRDDMVNRETLFETGHLWSEVLCLTAKQSLGPVVDPASDAVLTVLAGEGRFEVGGRRRSLKQWGAALVPAGDELSVYNVSEDPLVLLLVAAPPPPPSAPSTASS